MAKTATVPDANPALPGTRRRDGCANMASWSIHVPGSPLLLVIS
jgi:hypothetical protein